MKIKVYADPGHAWAKVERSKLEKLGILNKISSCSYQRGEFVYLEEDCDFSIFVNAVGRENVTIDESFSNRDSKIRSYECFSV